MLRASFGEEGKLDELEMMFDGIAVHQQLQRAMGGKQGRPSEIRGRRKETPGGRRVTEGAPPGERRTYAPTRQHCIHCSRYICALPAYLSNHPLI